MSDDGELVVWKRGRGRRVAAVVTVGQRFGELVITGRAPTSPLESKKRGTHVFVKCDCGHEGRMRLSSLVNRGATRCGSKRHFDRSRMETGAEMVGMRFGHLVVVSPSLETGNTQVLVRCDCGTERLAAVNHLRRGQIKSCNGPAHMPLAPTRGVKRLYQQSTYAIEAVGMDMIKIGRANDIRDRLLTLQASSPATLRLIASSTEDLEHKLHSILNADRLHGEWFRSSPHVMSVIACELQPASMSVIADLSRPGTRQNACKRCGERGHYAKTCCKPLEESRAA